MNCALCGKPVSKNDKNAYRRIRGWEKQRTAGEGVHPIRDREFEGSVAHGLCLEIEKHGGKQESLLA